MTAIKIAALEKVGCVGGCQSHPSGYAHQAKPPYSYSEPTPARIAEYALAALEVARKKDIDAHEKNLPQLAVNAEIRQRVETLMTEVGMPRSWSERDLKSRSRYPKTVTHEAGYLADLRRHVPIDDGFDQATRTYEALKKRYAEYATQAEAIARDAAAKREREEAAAKAERRANIEMASIILRYELDPDFEWDDILDALRSKDQRLNLAVAMQLTRGDWSEGPYRVENALGSFNAVTVEDRAIVEDIESCLEDFEDGRVFRDTTWSYDALYASITDRQLVQDAALALSKVPS